MRTASARVLGDRLTDALREELNVSEAIVRDGHTVIPRLRIMAPREQFIILLRLPKDPGEHSHRIHLLELFMAWKLATAFILSGERRDQHSIASLGVARDQRHGVMRRFDRGPPLSFAPIARVAEADIGRGLAALLPRRKTTMTKQMVAELEFVFGEDGAMPALRVR